MAIPPFPKMTVRDCESRTGGPYGSRAVGGSSAPLYGAESVVTEIGVEDADGAPGLRRVAKVGEGRVAARPHVFERDRVLAVDAHRERRIRAEKIVVSAGAGVGDRAA